MCGIVGYIGNEAAQDFLVEGLERLEYRGYDSAGIAVVQENEFSVVRALGKLKELKKELAGKPLFGTVGIGHTRWATHGKPSENNAHPHTAGRISLIHNGIIENYAELRKQLISEGVNFSSETDSEIAAQLLNRIIAEESDTFVALEKVCEQITGSYAFVALDKTRPSHLLIAKNSTPIIIGFGEDEVFVASDIPALLSRTRDVVILEDGDIAELSVDSLRIRNAGKEVERKQQRITWDPVTAQKGGFKHFMLKEIHEQPQVLMETFRGRVQPASAEVVLPEFDLSKEEACGLERVVIVACGTAWHAGLVIKNYIEHFAKLPCEVDYASEFRYRSPVLSENTLVIGVSQSGETADTLAAIELASGTTKVAAICNVLGSTLSRKVARTIFTHAGPEISVASTKAFTTQLVAGYLLALKLAELRGTLEGPEMRAHLDALFALPAAVESSLELSEQVAELAARFGHAQDFLFLGRGNCFPLALEGALKLKEISYIHAEGYPAGEMKHGPIALLDENVPVVAVVQRDSIVAEKTVSNLKEAESRNARIITITDIENHEELKAISEVYLELPFVSAELSPLVMTIPLQLLAYHVAVFKGTDVDLPRNLAKSVTVE